MGPLREPTSTPRPARYRAPLLFLFLAGLAQGFSLCAEENLGSKSPGGMSEVSLFEILAGPGSDSLLPGPVRRDRAARLLSHAEALSPASPSILGEGRVEEEATIQTLLGALDQELTQTLWAALHLYGELDPERVARLDVLRKSGELERHGTRTRPEWMRSQLEGAFQVTQATLLLPLTPPHGWDPLTDSAQAWVAWQAWVATDPQRDPTWTLLDFCPETLLLALALEQREHPEPDLLKATRRQALALTLLESSMRVDEAWEALQPNLRAAAIPLTPDPEPDTGSEDLPIHDFFRAVRAALKDPSRSPGP